MWNNVRVHLIFWGAAWLNGPDDGISADKVARAMDILLRGAAASGGAVAGSTVYAGSEPSDGFTDERVKSLVKSLIQAGSVPDPRRESGLLFYVVLPPNVAPAAAPRVFGKQITFSYKGERVQCAWVRSDVLGFTAYLDEKRPGDGGENPPFTVREPVPCYSEAASPDTGSF